MENFYAKKPLKSEFHEDPECYVIFSTNGLNLGRMIAASKSSYCKEHQGELVIFNANVITPKHGKVWYGDININLDFDKLKNVADQIGEDLYILIEGDARFGYENDPIKKLMKKARAVIKCNKTIEKSEKKKTYLNKKSKKESKDEKN